MKKFLILSVDMVLIISAIFFLPTSIETKAKNISALSDTNSRVIHIDGADYGNNFTPNGTASINENLGTLTEKGDTHSSGNTLLNTKIDMSQSFTLKGQVNLGDASQNNNNGGGSDGISFVFQPGDTNTVGGAYGIGGLKESFGFRLDTWFTATTSVDYDPDPIEFASDKNNPKNGVGYSFGAFMDGRTGIVQTISNGSLQISEPSSNQFKDVEVDYDGSTKILTVIYEGKAFSQNITSLLGDHKAMSFGISASAGYLTNLQQFKLSSFDYTVAQGTVVTHYVDDTGMPIADDDIQQGDQGSPWATQQKDIPGYSFKEIQGNPTGNYTANDQEVTYVYTRSPVAGGDVTAKYVDTDGQTISENVVKSGNVGENYTTEQKEIDGYTFKEVQGNPSGQFTDQPQTVIYVYDKVEESQPVTPEKQDPPQPESPQHGDSIQVQSQIEKTTTEVAPLPKTGDQTAETSLLMGLGTILFLLSGYVLRRTKNEKKNES